MSEIFQDYLIRMITAPTLDEVIALALPALEHLTGSQRAALVLWDVELKRYIVGDVCTPSPETAAPFRRQVLRQALAAYQRNGPEPHYLESSLWYQPFNTPEGHHLGAFLVELSAATKSQELAQDQDFARLIRVTTRALWMMTRIEQADREHAQLDAERQRLQQLLLAVDQQQQTIDRLLTLERQFSASLELQVEERTTALREAQARIIHSEKLAVIGQLAASLAHEINNPLQAIQSGLGLVIAELGGERIERVRNDLMMIQSELERLLEIFQQMLDFNRPAYTVRQVLDLNAICEGAMVLLRNKLQENQLELRLELAPYLPPIYGDSNQIKQVLINLILNSAEAMASVPGIITTCTKATGQQVQLTVEDSGVGIPTTHLTRLFEPFFTTKTRGLGLGLAISREIVERHHGEIIVQSEEGRGTVFTVFLPVEERGNGKQSLSADRG